MLLATLEFMNIQQTITHSLMCLLVWYSLAIAPTCAQTITHVPLFTFNGGSPSENFGGSVSDAGDVNGDGFDDLIVGAFGDDTNGIDSGSARVFSGVDGSVLYDFFGDSANDQFGFSVSGAGDVNGDGFDDLIVGAPNNVDDLTGGSARVFSGVDGSVLYDFFGDLPDDTFGFSVSGAGDVNGDGFDDLIVGVPLDDDGGSAQVLSGFDGSVLYNFDTNSPFNFLGFSVSGAGDVNGDGFADLIVGDPDGGFSNPGSATVYSGADGSVLHIFLGDSGPVFGVNGDDFGDNFGSSVSGAGDVNGDGFDDLIVGAPAVNFNGMDSGNARVLSGVDGSVLYDFFGDSAGDVFGVSVSGAGDVNGDGFADLIVGASADDNNGANSGSVRVLSGSDGSVLYTFDGDSANDLFGFSVSGAGDVNGDGLADFIVGSRGGTNAGFARVFVSQITEPPVLKGDVDLDGDVDFDDIGPFIAVLQSGVFQAEADCDCSTVVDFGDIPSFIAILQSQ